MASEPRIESDGSELLLRAMECAWAEQCGSCLNIVNEALPGVLAHSARLDRDRAALAARVRALTEALRLSAIRLSILTGRMRGCHAETGMHGLLGEAEMFEREARAALAAAGGD